VEEQFREGRVVFDDQDDATLLVDGVAVVADVEVPREPLPARCGGLRELLRLRPLLRSTLELLLRLAVEAFGQLQGKGAALAQLARHREIAAQEAREIP